MPPVEGHAVGGRRRGVGADVYGVLAAGLSVTAVAVVAAAASRWALAAGAPVSTWSQRAPFLGGGMPETHAWSRHHARYFPMALVLVAFEMEMMFMYPWAVVFVREGTRAFVEMAMFLGLLSVGVTYAWREGAFRWQ